jgi:hypothetical protein
VAEAIEGRIARKKNNALTLSFRNGPGDPLATALQGGADGKGSKAAVLFGFKNGGTGTHSLTYADGRVLHIKSQDSKPTLITQADGVEIATVERGETSVARLSGGTEVLRFVPDPDPDEARSLDAFRMRLQEPNGTEIGLFDVVRTISGWSLGMDLINTAIWWGRAGEPLKLPFLGTKLILNRALTPTELDIALAACVDTSIGLRPYVKAMSG